MLFVCPTKQPLHRFASITEAKSSYYAKNMQKQKFLKNYKLYIIKKPLTLNYYI